MNQKSRFKCLVDNCKNADRDYDYTSLMVHISRTHHIKAEEYAEIYKTERWKQCSKCHEFFFDKHNNKTYCVKCGHQIGVEKTAKTRRLRGDYEFERMSEISKKGWKTKIKNGTKNVGAQKAAKTNRENGHFEPDKVAERAKKAGPAISKWRKEHLEEVKVAAQKAADTIAANGKKIEMVIKAVKTRKDRGTDLIGAHKAADKMIAEGTYKEIGKKISKWCRDNPEKRSAAMKKAAAKAIITKRDNGYFDTLFFPSYSEESQTLFRELEQFLKNECFYATNGFSLKHTNEKRINTTRSFRFLDFYVPSINKCIEFDEEYHDKEKQKIYDKIREEEIKETNPNINLFRVRKEDFLRDPKDTIIDCLVFLEIISLSEI